jgi:hypothetical protein
MWLNVNQTKQNYHSINWRHCLHHHLLERLYRKKYHKKIQILMMTNNKKHLICRRLHKIQYNPMMETFNWRHNRDRTVRTKINNRTNKQMTKRTNKKIMSL